MKCPYSILWYISGTKWALIDWISGLYSKVPIAWLRVVLCSSIQFLRDLIKNLLTSFSRSVLKLRHLVFFFFFLIYGPGASQSGHKLKWKEKLNPVRNLQYGPRTRLVRGVFSSLDLNLWLQLWRKKKRKEWEWNFNSTYWLFTSRSCFRRNLRCRSPKVTQRWESYKIWRRNKKKKSIGDLLIHALDLSENVKYLYLSRRTRLMLIVFRIIRGRLAAARGAMTCIRPIPLSWALRNSAFGLQVRVISRQYTYTYIHIHTYYSSVRLKGQRLVI